MMSNLELSHLAGLFPGVEMLQDINKNLFNSHCSAVLQMTTLKLGLCVGDCQELETLTLWFKST